MLKYKTSDEFDSPQGFLSFCDAVYTRVARKKLEEIEEKTYELLCERNEKALAEHVLEQVFELAEDHVDPNSQKYEAHVWRFDVIQLWNEIFINYVLWEYVSKKELERRRLEGFRLELFYNHLEDIFKSRYFFKSKFVLPGYCRENETPADAKKRFDENMYVGEVKIPQKHAENVLLGVKFRCNTGLKFLAEKQGNYIKISLYKKNKFLWAEVVS